MTLKETREHEVAKNDRLDTVTAVQLKEISIDGLTCIGKGQNSVVYRLDQDTIVKLYKPCPQLMRQISMEKRNADAAYALRVPTARALEIVRVGENYGLMFEYLEAPSLRNVIAKEPNRLPDLAIKSAELLRRLHSLNVPKDAFPKISDCYRERVAGLADLLTPAEINLLNEMIDSIPERKTYIHGDYHRGNIMVRRKEPGHSAEDELLLIDMSDSSMGHPIYDVLGTYMLGINLVKTFPPDFIAKFIGWDTETIVSAWNLFKRTYFQTEDKGELAEIEAMLEAYCQLRWLTFLKIAPAVTEDMRKKSIEEARKSFFPMIRTHIERFKGRIEAMGCVQ